MSANGIYKHFIKSKNWALKTMSRDKLAPVSETGSQGGGRLGIPKMILLRGVEKTVRDGFNFSVGLQVTRLYRHEIMLQNLMG